MSDQLLVIEHADGRRYAVSAAAFHRDYEPEGFTAVAYEDGSEYTAPTKQPALTKVSE